MGKRDEDLHAETFGQQMAEMTAAINAELRRTVDTLLSNRLQGCLPFSIASLSAGQTDASAKASLSGGILLGWSLRDLSGTGSTVIFRDAKGATNVGSNTPASEIAGCGLAAGETNREWFGDIGISFGDGLFLDCELGQIAGTVYLGRN